MWFSKGCHLHRDGFYQLQRRQSHVRGELKDQLYQLLASREYIGQLDERLDAKSIARETSVFSKDFNITLTNGINICRTTSFN